MPSTRLAVTMVALVCALTALDMSGAHRPAAADAGDGRAGGRPVIAASTVRGGGDGDAPLGRVLPASLLAGGTPPGQTRAAHPCANSEGKVGNARYCFGAPTPTIDYH